MSVGTVNDTEKLAEKENVTSAGDTAIPNGDNETSEDSDKDEDAGAMTPHRLIVKKQRFASKLLKKRIAAKDVPVAQVFLPAETSWRIHDTNTTTDDFFDVKTQWSNYRDNFFGKDHNNYIGLEVDVPKSPVIISVMNENSSTEIIVRTASGTCSEILQNSSESNIGAICEETDVLNLAKIMMPDLKVQSISIIDGYQELIKDYDNNYHQLLNRKKYTFGVLYQKGGQTSEQEIFANVEHCDKFDQFLQLLGSFELKSEYDNLGYYTKKHEDLDFRFYVLTRLPYSETDSQQCFRKARIGNCVLSIVFQAEEATFCPEIITSQFLHVYVVILPLESDQFKISIVTKSGVPNFGPTIDAIETINRETFGRFLSLLCSAEQAAYTTGKLSELRKKYRIAGLTQITQKIEADQIQKEVFADGGRWKCALL